jgi:hypothetical protein
MWEKRFILISAVAVLCVCALAAMGWLMIGRPARNRDQRVSMSGTTGIPEARILQFYATQSLIGRGAATSLCYGVEKAASVRLDPELPVTLDPVAFRCFSVQPSETTQFELTAVDRDGREVSKTVSVLVQ